MATKYSSDHDRSRQRDRDTWEEYHQRRSHSTSKRADKLPKRLSHEYVVRRSPNSSRFHEKDFTRRGRASSRYSHENITRRRSDSTLLSEEDLFRRGRNLSGGSDITQNDSRLHYEDINRRERNMSYRGRHPTASRLSLENVDRRRRSLSRHDSRDNITRSTDRLSREDLKRKEGDRPYYPELTKRGNSNTSRFSQPDLIKKDRNSSPHHSRENIRKRNHSRKLSHYSRENVLKINSKTAQSSHENINKRAKSVSSHQSRDFIARKSSVDSRLSRKDINIRQQHKSARYSGESPTTSRLSNTKTSKTEKNSSPHQSRESSNTSRLSIIGRNISPGSSRENFTKKTSNKYPQLRSRSFSATNSNGRTFNTYRKSRSIEKELNVINYQDPPKTARKRRDLSNHSTAEDNLCLCPWAIFKRCNTAIKKMEQTNEFPNKKRAAKQFKNEVIERTQYLDIRKDSPPRSSKRNKKRKK